MDWIVRLLAVVSASLATVGLTGVELSTPETSKPMVYVREPQATATTTTLPAGLRCPEWYGLAQHAGWHAESMPTLDYVIWRESRCNPAAHNTRRNRDGSTDLGLTQINDRSWCLPTRWYPSGYLQSLGILEGAGCEQLFDPLMNLKAAKALYDYSQEQQGNGWAPWSL